MLLAEEKKGLFHFLLWVFLWRRVGNLTGPTYISYLLVPSLDSPFIVSLHAAETL